MLGVSGILAEGTLTVEFDSLQEIAFTLGNAEKLSGLDKEKNLGESSVLLRLANSAGFTLEREETNEEGRKKYIFFLTSKWEYISEVFMRELVSFGLGVQSGFSDKDQNFFWFLRSEYGSKSVVTDSYEL